jgi:hypothetical protein
LQFVANSRPSDVIIGPVERLASTPLDLVWCQIHPLRSQGNSHLAEAAWRADLTAVARCDGKLLMFFAGWVHRGQLEVIDYLKEENRVLQEQLGGRRLRLANDQRRRLVAKGRLLGWRRLKEHSGLVTPETLLRWYRDLIARKYDGTARRGSGRPASAANVHSS